jgi:hypothetical protein
MIDYTALPTAAIVPAMLAVYALAFIAGGIYYLEQQTARLRDLFPKIGPMVTLIGWTALGIGLLAMISIGGMLLGQGPRFGYGALLSTASGFSFWVIRIHVDPTRASRLRNSLLALLCALLTVLTAWWITSI